MDTLHQNITDAEQQIPPAKEAFDAEREKLKQLEVKVSQADVKKVHQLLDKKNPPFLSKMCESMVALLRCQNNVNSKDVDSYFGNFDGLMYRM